MSGWRVVCAGVMTLAVGGLAAGLPASGQTSGGPTVSISPTSGPIGTDITATVANCTPPANNGEARVDFNFEGFTPSNSTFFTPAADGSATVHITAEEKEGQSENLTAAEVHVSQCGNSGFDTADFTVTRSSATTTTAPSGSTTTTTRPPSTTTTVAAAATTTTTVKPAVLGQAPVATPVAGRPNFTG